MDDDPKESDMSQAVAEVDKADTDEGTESAPATTRSDTGEQHDARKRPVVTILAALVVVLLVVTAVLSVLWYRDHSDLSDVRATAAGDRHAESVALDYARGAANLDYRDLKAWTGRLTANTSQELNAKLTEAATSMQQVITPLQWTSTATPIAAQVKSHNGSLYEVLAFISVNTKNAQAPDGVQSTATYTITMDSARDWTITDVGGLATPGLPK